MGEFVRLQKYIARCGTASRRAAEKMIAEGRIKVNGTVVTEPGVKVEIGADKVYADNELIKIIKKKYYIMLNKPVGYISSVHDRFGRPTVTDLVKKDISANVVPVGRLDFDTSGLILLSNDGDFTYRVTHPKFKTDKTYIAELKGGITVSGLNALRRGVRIEDYKTSPAEVEIIDSRPGFTTVKITIHEGKNRQVRKMFETVGSSVHTLSRISIGGVHLGHLAEGKWRYLTGHEINMLMHS
ncbi:MAG: rRNA pseudouridine synthase [Oscillospiraceae bacterium]|nr:rRNA pseudouridine synthase [Oscillospiraceae bacterium]